VAAARAVADAQGALDVDQAEEGGGIGPGQVGDGEVAGDVDVVQEDDVAGPAADGAVAAVDGERAGKIDAVDGQLVGAVAEVDGDRAGDRDAKLDGLPGRAAVQSDHGAGPVAGQDEPAEGVLGDEQGVVGRVAGQGQSAAGERGAD